MTDKKQNIDTQEPVIFDRGAYFCTYCVLIPAFIFAGVYRSSKAALSNRLNDAYKNTATLMAKSDSIMTATTQKVRNLDMKIQAAESDSVKQELINEKLETLRDARKQITMNWNQAVDIMKQAGIAR